MSAKNLPITPEFLGAAFQAAFIQLERRLSSRAPEKKHGPSQNKIEIIFPEEAELTPLQLFEIKHVSPSRSEVRVDREADQQLRKVLEMAEKILLMPERSARKKNT